MSTLYISRLVKIAEEAAAANAEAFAKASSAVCETLANRGLVHLYGSGHSVLPVQETYPRYGSYLGFNPLTDPRPNGQPTAFAHFCQLPRGQKIILRAGLLPRTANMNVREVIVNTK